MAHRLGIAPEDRILLDDIYAGHIHVVDTNSSIVTLDKLDRLKERGLCTYVPIPGFSERFKRSGWLVQYLPLRAGAPGVIQSERERERVLRWVSKQNK